MVRHAARAVPWALVSVASVLIVGLMVAVRWRAWTLWPLEGVAVGLLAGAVGWCLDEPGAAVVDVAPRGLAWRTAARSAGVGVLLAAWAAGVWWARDALFGHPAPVLLQGVAAAAVAAAWASWRRVRGEASPGGRWAVVVIPVTTAWALVRPLARTVPVFPYADPDATWAASAAGWTVVAAGAVLALAATLAGDGRPVRLPTTRRRTPRSRR